MSRSLTDTSKAAAFICIYEFSAVPCAPSQLAAVFSHKLTRTLQIRQAVRPHGEIFRRLARGALTSASMLGFGMIRTKLYEAARSHTLPVTGQSVVRQCRARLLRIQRSAILDETLEMMQDLILVAYLSKASF